MTQWTIGILEITLTMSVLIAILLLLFKVAGTRFSARCRYLIWLVVIARLCIPVGTVFPPALFTLELPRQTAMEDRLPDASPTITAPDNTQPLSTTPPQSVPVTPPTAGTTPDISVKEPPQTPSDTDHTYTPIPSTPGIPADTAQTPSVPQPLDTSWIFPALAALHLCGTLCYFGYHIITYHVCRMRYARERTLCNRDTMLLYRALCVSMEITDPPLLYRCAGIGSPLVYGYLHPVVLLPEYDPGDRALRGILAHELTHARRRDVYTKLLALIAVSLHWFNPLVHIAVARFHAETELSCDEEVLTGLGEDDRRTYGLAMLDVVKHCKKHANPLTTQFNPKKNAVRERFVNILDMTKKRRGIPLIAATVALSLFAGVVFGCTESAETPPDDGNTEQDTATTDTAVTDGITTDSAEPSTDTAETVTTDSAEPSTDTTETTPAPDRTVDDLLRRYIDGELSVEELLSEKSVYDRLCDDINECLSMILSGDDVVSRLPNPSSTTKIDIPDGYEFVYTDIAYPETLLYYNHTTADGKNKISFHTGYAHIPKSDLVIDFYWSVAYFGDGIQIYVEDIDTYLLWEHFAAFRPAKATELLSAERIFGTNTYVLLFEMETPSPDGAYLTEDWGTTYQKIDLTLSDAPTVLSAEIIHHQTGYAGESSLLVALTRQDGIEYALYSCYNTYPAYELIADASSTTQSPLDRKQLLGYLNQTDLVFPNRNTPDTVDALDELSLLGISETDARYKYIEAFTTGDTVTLEEVCGVTPGMYDEYRKMKVEKWVAYLETTETGHNYLHFSFKVTGSSFFENNTMIDGYIVSEGLNGVYLHPHYDSHVRGLVDASNSQEFLISFLQSASVQDIPTTDDMDDITRWLLTCFLTNRIDFGDYDRPPITLETMQKYAYDYFGIEGFTPHKTHKIDGGYGEVGHGGHGQAFRVISHKQNDNIVTMQVQFYADASKTVKSDLWEYVFEEDLVPCLVSCTKLDDAEYEPYIVAN